MKRSKTLGILWHSRFFCLIFDLSASFDIKMRQINSFLGIYYQDRHLCLLPRHQYQHHRTNIKRNAGCWRNPKSRERKRYRIYCQIKDPVIIYRPHFRFICLIWYQNDADKFIFWANNWENELWGQSHSVHSHSSWFARTKVHLDILSRASHLGRFSHAIGCSYTN